MNPEFIPPIELGELVKKIKAGDQMAEELLYSELSRLESLIKGYEVVIESINDRFNSKHYKTPMIKSPKTT